jgi:chromosome partitioning protein
VAKSATKPKSDTLSSPLADAPLPTAAADSFEHDFALMEEELAKHFHRIFPPDARKTMRSFQPTEVAQLLGVHDAYLRQLVAEGKVVPDLAPSGRRTYTVEHMHQIRQLLGKGRGGKKYLPHRSAGEKLQVITVMNFKGGSGKTTSAAHLSQYLGLRGYRVLVIDLDPQASLSAIYGFGPSQKPVLHNETLYGAIRYDNERRSMAEVVQYTFLPDVHIVPGNLELMEFEHTTPLALRERDAQAKFFARIGTVLGDVQDNYDVVVIDCPPQLGFLTLSALCAATAVITTVHPSMLDVLSMGQFLEMTSDLLAQVRQYVPDIQFDWRRYMITRFEPGDGPQNQMVAFLRQIYGDRVLIHPTLKSTLISDAAMTNQTVFEVERMKFVRSTYDRALESVMSVNREIEDLICKTWGRS